MNKKEPQTSPSRNLKMLSSYTFTDTDNPTGKTATADTQYRGWHDKHIAWVDIPYQHQINAALKTLRLSWQKSAASE